MLPARLKSDASSARKDTRLSGMNCCLLPDKLPRTKLALLHTNHSIETERGDNLMAKEQKRSNKEVRKPKKSAPEIKTAVGAASSKKR